MHDAQFIEVLERRTVWPAALAGAAALLVGIGLGRFGYAPLIPALIDAGWFDAAAADYLGATNLAGYIVGAVIAGPLARSLRPATLIAAGMLAAAVSFAACALPSGFAWYFVWRLVSGVAGGVVMVLAAPTVLALARPERRARAGGIVFAGVGAGIALSGTLVPRLVQWGVSETWLVFAVASALLAPFAWKALARPAPAAAAFEIRRSPPAMRRALVLLMLAYAGAAIGFVPHTVFWVDYVARGLGAGLGAGGFYWTLLGVAAALGPLAAGLIGDRLGGGIGAAWGFRATMIAMAAAVAVPLLSTHPAARAFSSIGAGALTMAATALASVVVGALVPPEAQRRVWGWMTVVYALAYAGAGYALSFVFAVTDSYTPIFATGAVALFGGSAFAWLADRAARAQRQ